MLTARGSARNATTEKPLKRRALLPKVEILLQRSGRNLTTSPIKMKKKSRAPSGWTRRPRGEQLHLPPLSLITPRPPPSSVTGAITSPERAIGRKSTGEGEAEIKGTGK